MAEELPNCARPLQSVHFITGCDKGGAHRYRCHHACEQLSLYGIAGRVLDYYRDEISLSEVLASEIIVLHRVAWDSQVKELVGRARNAGRMVVFDTDDLVFEPELTHWVRVLSILPPQEVEEYQDGVRRYLRTLEAADCVITPTPFLAAFARQRGKPAFVHRNALCTAQLAICEEWYQKRQERKEPTEVIVGYFSGTNTHDWDFREAAPALAMVLEEFPQVELHIGGHLNLPPELTGWQTCIRRLPHVDWRKLPGLLSAIDINLAPLEGGNPYCRAKSEVKYFEAGVLGIPTVASRIDPYQWAIRHGENGLLVSGVREWVEALRALIRDASLRRELGERARADVYGRYTPQVRAQELIQTLTLIQKNGSSVLPGSARDAAVATAEKQVTSVSKPSLTLNWVVPEPFPGSGGHTGIFRIINYLDSFGHRSRLYVVPAEQFLGERREGIARFIAMHFGELRAEVYRWGGPLRPADAVVATHWTTAYLVHALPASIKKFYFVQDFEPYFYPVGTEYLQAENTYKMPFSYVTLGSWLARVLRERYGVEADAFDFAVDQEIYFPRSRGASRRPTVVFYARRSTPRRGFELGREALMLVYQQMPETSIVLFGEEKLEPGLLPFPYTNAGVLSPPALAELYASANVGLVLSLTNCSFVPLEMMACKCAVVDVRRETVEGVLCHEENALLAEPHPQAVAASVVRLLREPDLRERLVECALVMVQGLSWERSARQVEESLLRRFQEWRQARRERPQQEREAGQVEVLEEICEVIEQQQAEREHYEHQLRRAADFIFRVRRSLLYRLYGTIMGLRRVAALGRVWRERRQERIPLGELRGRKAFGQTFVARANNLYRVDVLVGTYARLNTRPVVFHLRESPDAQQDLATATVEAWRLRDNQYHSFVFSPQPDSQGKTYYFFLTSPESIRGDAITLWAYPQSRRGDCLRYQNSEAVAGEIVFRVHYQAQPAEGEKEEEEWGWFHAATPWWQLPAKALAVVRHAGVSEAIRRIRLHRLRRGDRG